jgi:hypothetical protein
MFLILTGPEVLVAAIVASTNMLVLTLIRLTTEFASTATGPLATRVAFDG